MSVTVTTTGKKTMEDIMSLLREKGFFWGVCCGLLAGLALTVTIAHAVGPGQLG